MRNKIGYKKQLGKSLLGEVISHGLEKEEGYNEVLTSVFFIAADVIENRYDLVRTKLG